MASKFLFASCVTCCNVAFHAAFSTVETYESVKMSQKSTPSVTCIESEDEDDCFKAWDHDLRLSEHDKKSLQSHAWLSANHISAAHLMLKSKFPNQNGMQDTSYLIDGSQMLRNLCKLSMWMGGIG